jgi:nucleoside 2-deoxyribosyltransferase
MSNTRKYDYIVVGRWRNRDNINAVKQALRKSGKSVYCFTDNSYDGHGIKFETHQDADPEAMMSVTENLADWQTNPTFRNIFETDMRGLQEAEALILVFPSGLAAHMELGVAYGLGKKCYGIGELEKTETLYLMFDKLFPDVNSLLNYESKSRKEEVLYG